MNHIGIFRLQATTTMTRDTKKLVNSFIYGRGDRDEQIFCLFHGKIAMHKYILHMKPMEIKIILLDNYCVIMVLARMFAFIGLDSNPPLCIHAISGRQLKKLTNLFIFITVVAEP